MCEKFWTLSIFCCTGFSFECIQFAGFPFDYGKYAAGAFTSGLDSIHLKMAEFAPAFDAGGMGMDRLPGRIFLCFPFLPLDAPLPFMPEQ